MHTFGKMSQSVQGGFVQQNKFISGANINLQGPPELIAHQGTALQPTDERPIPKPVYGFYDDETGTFLFCQSYDEYMSFMSLTPPNNHSTLFSDHLDEDPWQHLLEVFNDSRFSEPLPDVRLQQVLD